MMDDESSCCQSHFALTTHAYTPCVIRVWSSCLKFLTMWEKDLFAWIIASDLRICAPIRTSDTWVSVRQRDDLPARRYGTELNTEPVARGKKYDDRKYSHSPTAWA